MKQIKFGQLFTLNNKVYQYRKCKTKEELISPCSFCNAQELQHVWIGNHYEYTKYCMKNLPECDLLGYFKRIK